MLQGNILTMYMIWFYYSSLGSKNFLAMWESSVPIRNPRIYHLPEMKDWASGKKASSFPELLSSWHITVVPWAQDGADGLLVLGTGLARTELLFSLPAALASWECVLPTSARLVSLSFSCFNSIHLPGLALWATEHGEGQAAVCVLCSPLDDRLALSKARWT